MTPEKQLQKMIEEQIKLFKNAVDPFDYKKIFEVIDKGCEIQDRVWFAE